MVNDDTVIMLFKEGFWNFEIIEVGFLFFGKAYDFRLVDGMSESYSIISLRMSGAIAEEVLFYLVAAGAIANYARRKGVSKACRGRLDDEFGSFR